MIGQTLGDYRIDAEIGRGGMGMVYRARHLPTGDLVALKAIKSDMADEQMVERFQREGKALRQLNHPNIVKMLEAFEANGQHFLVMELMTSGSLRDLMDEQPHMTVKRVLEIALDLCDALTRAHRLNIIHRDLKPANILMAVDGTPRLSDFGMARVIGSNITESGVITGTFGYLPPEAFQDGEANARFDIWAFGVILFEMLTGDRPFHSDQLAMLIQNILIQPLPDLEALRPDVPLTIVDLIHRMLDKDPMQRIPSVRIIGSEIEAIMQGREYTPTPVESTLPDEPATMIYKARFDTPSPAPTSSLRLRHNLPTQTTPFVGRDGEIEQLMGFINDPQIRLVTIMASGGMGKSRISLEVGERLVSGKGSKLFQDGIFFVELAPLSDPMNIAPTIAEAVGYPFQGDGRTPKQQLLEYFQEKHQLLILDNFEHVLDGAELVNDILQSAPNIEILVTSRAKLNLSGEHVFILESLGFPDWETPADALEYSAVKLFMQSAKRAQPGFELQADDLQYVARICRMVRGMPLGILLAAGWLNVLSVREIVEEMSQSLDFLESEQRDLPERQRSIRAVFDYSWDLLQVAERDTLTQLSIFRGSFAREAAQTITGANLRSLQTLVNKSLLRRDVMSGRYEIHELLRQYAQQRLEDAGQAASVRTAHSHYYLNELAKLAPTFKGQGQVAALTTIEHDFDNIRAAWEWAVEQRDATLINHSLEGMYLFTNIRTRLDEGRRIFQQARAAWQDSSPLAAKLLVRHPDDSHLQHFKQGLAKAEQRHDTAEIAFCQRLIGHWLSHSEYNHDEGVPNLQASFKLYESLGEDYYAAQVLDDLGWSYNLIGDNEQSRQSVEQCLAIRRQIGDKIGTANALRNMGGATGGFNGISQEPLRYWIEAKALSYEVGDRLGVAWNAILLAILHMVNDEFEEAVPLVQEAQPIALELNDPVVKGLSFILQSLFATIVERDVVKGQQLLDIGFPPDTPPDFRMSLVGWAKGVLLVEQSNPDGILELIQHIFAFGGSFATVYKIYIFSVFLPMIVFIRTKRGDYVHATELLSARLNFPHVLWVKRWRVCSDLQTQLKNILGDTAYTEAWERGKLLDIDVITDELIAEVQQSGE